jgi:AraC family transcriptional regulator, arabinose operon regulatory protein
LFLPSIIQANWNRVTQKLGPSPLLSFDSASVQLLQHAYQAAKQKQITDGFRASTLVYQFVMALQQYSCSALCSKANWPEPVQQAADEMEQQYRNLRSLDEIVQLSGLSKFYFARLFHQSTDRTPIKYLTKIRIKRAISLLLHSSLTLENIAREIGFSSSSYFIKIFRKWTGFSPGEFRSGRALTDFSFFTFD